MTTPPNNLNHIIRNCSTEIEGMLKKRVSKREKIRLIFERLWNTQKELLDEERKLND